MSDRTIMEKVLEIKFDNRNFEKNAQESLSTIDKLKNSLNFQNLGKGLANVANGIRDLDFSPVGNSLETVRVRFSIWEAIAINALTKIADKVVDLGVKMVKSLSVDQLTQGWSKYESKVSSVQTIMAATESTWQETAKQLEFTGTQMEFVSDQLQKLNWFSDETSYSFADMTNNIGKFTSSGIALDKSVEAMEGISVWASLSGQNAQSASRAYYNLAQAISVGSVKLIDWKSIENANMATMEFKQTAIETAVEMGELKKVGDGLWITHEGNEVSVKNFNEALKDEWFTADVLMKTLSEYGKAASYLSNIYEEYGITASQFISDMEKVNKGTMTLEEASEDLEVPVEKLTEYFKTLSSEEYALGLKAFKAAQEAKTFTEAIEATKDAVSTGWMNTFELISGNYEEAKGFYTEMANRLYDVFAAGAEARNEILGMWHDEGGRDELIDAFWGLWDAISAVSNLAKEAFHEIFPEKDTREWADTILALTVKLKGFVMGLQMSEETSAKLKRFFVGLASAIDIVRQSTVVLTKPLAYIFSLFKDVPSTILDVAASFGDYLTTLNQSIKESDFFGNIADTIVDKLKTVYTKITTLIANVKSTVETFISYVTLMYEKYSNIFKHIANVDMNIFAKVYGSLHAGLMLIVEVFSDAFYELTGIDISAFTNYFLEEFEKFTMNMMELINDIKFDKIITAITEAYNKIKEYMKGFGEIDTSGFTGFVDEVKEKFDPLGAIFGAIEKVFGGIINFFKSMIPTFLVLADWIGSALSKIGSAIATGLTTADFEPIYAIINGGFLTVITGGIMNFVNNISKISGVVTSIQDNFVQILMGVQDCLQAWQQNLKASILLKIAIAIGIITVALIALSFVDTEKLMGATAVITAEFYEFVTALKAVSALDLAKLAGISGPLIALAAAILIMSIACSSLGKLEADQVLSGVAGVGTLALILVKVAESLNSANITQLTKGAGTLILFALAITILAIPVKMLAKLSWEELAKGLSGVVILMYTLTELTNKLKADDISKAAIAMVGMGIALRIIASAVVKIAGLSWEELAKGLAGVVISMYMLTECMNRLPNGETLKGTGINLVLMAAAMVILSKAMKTFGSMSLLEMGTSLIMLAGSLILITATLEGLGMSTGIEKGAAAIAIVSAALLMLAPAMKIFGSMSLIELGTSLLMLASSLILMSVAANSMTGAVAGAAAMLIMANAILVMAPALRLIGSMPLKSIGKALLVLVGVLVIFGAAAYVLAPLTPVLLSLSAALLIFGFAVLAVGGGVLLLATGLTALAIAGTSGITALIAIILELVGLIPAIAKRVGQGIVEILKAIGNSADQLCQVAVQVGSAILDALKQLLPRLLDFLLYLLDLIQDNIYNIVDKVIDIVMEMARALRDKIPELAQAALDLVIGLINGLSQAIIDHAEEIRDAVYGFCEAIITAILVFFGMDKEDAALLIDTAKDIFDGFCKGIGEMLGPVVEKVIEVCEAIVDKIKEYFPVLYEVGSNLMHALARGIGLEKVEYSGHVTDNPVKATEEVMEKIKQVPRHCFRMRSPSKVFIEYGKYIDEGLIIGMQSMSDDIVKTSELLANSVITSVEEPINEVNDLLDDNYTYNPKITPVLDLNNIRNDARTFSSTIDDKNMRMALNASGQFENNLTNKIDFEKMKNINDDVVSELVKLRAENAMLGEKISNLNMVLDSGTLVGQLSPMISSNIGRMVRRGER